MKVLYAASEAYPFIKTGGLADVAGALPKALAEAGTEVSVILPYYQDIPGKFRADIEFVKKFWVNLSWRNQYCGLMKTRYGGVDYYFIDNLYYFGRKGLYGYYDDAERFAFFSRAVLEVLPTIGMPDVIHANDWQTGMIPVFLDKFYRHKEAYRDLRVLFTIHNIEYQGVFDPKITEDVLGLGWNDYEDGAIRHGDAVNFMKAAIRSSSWVSTVSPSYAKEILTPQYGAGLDGELREYREKLSGILNGIDCTVNDPEKDTALFSNYGVSKLASGKKANKKALQEMLGLSVADVPMIAIVSRLVDHKGMGLVASVLGSLLAEDIQLVVLGTGDWKYEEMFRRAALDHPGKVSANILFNSDLASKIYAAADLLLMPSVSEPCGLSQMIAMRYGTVPVVHEAGGLKDSVTPRVGETGNGFCFAAVNAGDMLNVIRQALSLYAEPSEWAKLRKRAASCDFSWKKPAEAYIELYEKIKA